MSWIPTDSRCSTQITDAESRIAFEIDSICIRRLRVPRNGDSFAELVAQKRERKKA